MKDRVNLNSLKINGHDPRMSKSFLLLSSELSPLNGSLPANVDWKLLEDKCYRLFYEYGYDLQSGVWFCLINLRLKSWKGLAMALDLLSTAFTHNGQRCWPPASAVQKRQYLIDWFCANVATHIYTLAHGPEDSGDMRQVEKGIAVLCEQAKGLQSRSHDSLINLLYFLQVRCRSAPYPQARAAKVTAARTPAAESKLPRQAAKPETQNTSEPEVSLRSEPKPRPYLWALSGLSAGVALCVTAFGLWFYVHSASLSEKLTAPLARLQQSEKELDAAWHNAAKQKIAANKASILQRAAPVLEGLGQQLTDSPLRQGNLLAQRLEQHFPGNPVSGQWQRSLKEKSGGIPALDGIINANKHLDQLEARLLNAEKRQSQYMTVSELKTAVYQIRQDLQSNGVAAETLLWEMRRQREAGGDIDPVLLKQAAMRVESLNANLVSISER